MPVILTKRSIHRVPVGGTLHVRPYEARVLVAVGVAKYPDDETPQKAPKKPAKKRTYQRRDMRAEQ